MNEKLISTQMLQKSNNLKDAKSGGKWRPFKNRWSK